jgi:hypothetical protein
MMIFLKIQFTAVSAIRVLRFAGAALVCMALTIISIPFCTAQTAQTLQPASTPPMGWNSWDSYGFGITEDEFASTTDILHQQLQQYGWVYAVIDEGWYLDNPYSNGKPAWKYVLSPDGRYLPSESRFPSAADGVGFKKIADQLHSRDLKFGIHIVRGIPKEAVAKNLPIADSSFHAADAADTSDTCRWNPDNYGVRDNAAGQAYYDSLVKLYAGWGVDFLKVDCITVPYRVGEIHMLSEAIRKTGRPIVLSLSPGPTPIEQAADVTSHAQMWRTSDDFWDHWDVWPDASWSQSLKGQFAEVAKWRPYAGPGHWPDADMLPIGYLGPHPGFKEARMSGLSDDEQQTLITLWSVSRSPLILGGDLHHLDARLLNLLTNPEVLSVDQASSGEHAIVQTADSVVWESTPALGGGAFVAIFNLSDSARTLHYTWADLGITLQKRDRLRDLWALKSQKIKKQQDGITVALNAHASALYRVGGKGFEHRSIWHYFY